MTHAAAAAACVNDAMRPELPEVQAPTLKDKGHGTSCTLGAKRKAKPPIRAYTFSHTLFNTSQHVHRQQLPSMASAHRRASRSLRSTGSPAWATFQRLEGDPGAHAMPKRERRRRRKQKKQKEKKTSKKKASFPRHTISLELTVPRLPVQACFAGPGLCVVRIFDSPLSTHYPLRHNQLRRLPLRHQPNQIRPPPAGVIAIVLLTRSSSFSRCVLAARPRLIRSTPPGDRPRPAAGSC